MATPPALSRTLHRCRVQRNTIQCRIARNHHQTFQWGKLFPKEGKQQQWNHHVILGMYHMGILGKQNLAMRSQERAPVRTGSSLTNSKEKWQGSKLYLLFSLPRTHVKDTALAGQRACPSQLLCWPWAPDQFWVPTTALRCRRLRPSLFSPNFSLGPSDQASSEREER